MEVGGQEGKWPGQGWPRGLGPVLSHVVYHSRPQSRLALLTVGD